MHGEREALLLAFPDPKLFVTALTQQGPDLVQQPMLHD